MRFLASLLAWEHIADIGYWLVFFIGQNLYVLKRADTAYSSGKVLTRGSFLRKNWPTLVIRMMVPELVIFWIVRHVSSNVILGWFSVPVPGWIPMGTIHSWLAFFCFGFCADSGVNWLLKWQRIPEKIRLFLADQIPDVPEAQAKLAAAATKNEEAGIAIKQASQAVADEANKPKDV